jgi:hypothetical protein
LYRLSRSILSHPSFSGIAKLIPVRQVAMSFLVGKLDLVICHVDRGAEMGANGDEF